MHLFLNISDEQEKQMEKQKTIKIICDSIIILVCIFLAAGIWYLKAGERYLEWYFAVLILCAGVSAADMLQQLRRPKESSREPVRDTDNTPAVKELLLLDENNKPVKAWNMAGRISMIIGRRNEEEEIDVDLEDCEYSTFVEYQHAVLNYCLEGWYVEDLGSANGVRIQKAEDGCCYKVTNRPCRVEAGDIIYVANIKLLLS